MQHMNELALQQGLQKAQEAVRLMEYVRETMHGYRQAHANARGGWDLTRALNAIAEGRNLETVAPIEFAASAAVASRLGREPQPGCIFLPTTRDLTSATAAAGGYLVGTNLAPGEFWIDALRPANIGLQMGVQLVPMGGGNVTVPRFTGQSTAYWLTNEGASTTESQGTLGQVAATPKTVGTYGEMSRQLLLQGGPFVTNVILTELARSVGSKADAALLNGSGASGEPLGIVGTSGIGSVTGASIAHAGIMEFQSDVLAANASVNASAFGYVTTPTVASTLSGRQRFTGSNDPLWLGALVEGTLGGRKAMATGACPASTIVAGDWSSVALLDWGGIEVGVNPYGADVAAYKAGLVGLRCFWSVDVAVLRPSSFSIAQSVT